MLQLEVAAKREKGRRVFDMISKMLYMPSVGDDETLAAMLQFKEAKELKKGDRLVLSSTVRPEENLDTVLHFQIEAISLMPYEGYHMGMIIFEISSTVQEATMGPKGTSFRMTVVDFQTAEEDMVRDEQKLELNDELIVFVKEAQKNLKILTLNEGITLPKRAEKKKEVEKLTGKEHIKIFSELSSICGDGRESRESVKKIKDVRRALSWMRMTVDAKISLMCVTEGGLKPSTYLLEMILTASRDYLSGNELISAGASWQEIQHFPLMRNLRIMNNKEFFQDFAVQGTWEETKNGKLLDQFLPMGETVNDDDVVQLVRILRNMEIVTRISHGSVWEDVFKIIIQKLESGALGRSNPPQIKWIIGETWESCSNALREDSNTIILTSHGIQTSYDIDNVQEVVKLFKSRISNIPETDYATGMEFEKRYKERKIMETTESHKSRLALATKHSREEGKTDEEPPWKVTVQGSVKPAPGGSSRSGGKSRKLTDYEVEKSLGRTTKNEPFLCIFNLRYQLLNAKNDCKKGEECGRDHYQKGLKGTPGYRWTLQTLSKQVEGAPLKILNKIDKGNLLEELKTEFSA